VLRNTWVTHKNLGVSVDKKGKSMASRKENSEVTSAKAASAAAKVLRDPKSSKAAKTAAASALTQRPNKK
jgi:hypothetical protein